MDVEAAVGTGVSSNVGANFSTDASFEGRGGVENATSATRKGSVKIPKLYNTLKSILDTLGEDTPSLPSEIRTLYKILYKNEVSEKYDFKDQV